VEAFKAMRDHPRDLEPAGVGTDVNGGKGAGWGGHCGPKPTVQHRFQPGFVQVWIDLDKLWIDFDQL
jgi:hypothetical protein